MHRSAILDPEPHRADSLPALDVQGGPPNPTLSVTPRTQPESDRTISSDGRGASPQYMPIADAICDAETLRINMLYGSIFDATYGMGEDFTERDAKRQASISAHAIFLACPGLRG